MDVRDAANDASADAEAAIDAHDADAPVDTSSDLDAPIDARDADDGDAVATDRPQDVIIPSDLGCAPPLALCGGTCVNTGTSTAHCGGCGITCAAPCVMGQCTEATVIAVGTDHSCAVLRGGSLRCWGDNGNGRLGDGTTMDRTRQIGRPHV